MANPPWAVTLAMPLLLVAFAGCTGSPDGATASAPDAVPAPAVGTPADAPEAPEASPAPAPVPWMPAPRPEPLPPTTIHFHNDEDCTNGCSCSPSLKRADLEERTSPCGGVTGGRLPFGSPCGGHCLQGSGRLPAHPEGTPVRATIYLTNDGVDTHTVRVSLLQAGKVIVDASSDEATTVGAAGLVHKAFEVSSTTLAAIDPGAPWLVAVEVDHTQSWFMGFDEPAASTMVLGE